MDNADTLYNGQFPTTTETVLTLATRDLELPQVSEEDDRKSKAKLMAAFNAPDPPSFFLLRVTQDEGLYIAHDVNLDIYGTGHTEKAALADFLQAAHEHLRVLEDRPRLSHRLKDQRDRLREILAA